MKYVEKIDDLRLKKGWSILELGYQCDGLSEEAVRSIMYKRRVPLISSLETISKALEIHVAELFLGADEFVVKMSQETKILISLFETLPAENKNLLLALIELCTKVPL